MSGQAIVGQQITSAWWPNSYEVTQGYGATDNELEPPGHGVAHWHAGVDVGAPCGTTIHLPSGIDQATVSAVDNPGGYGTALVVHLQGFDVWFGHLRSRLVKDGDTVKSGAALAISNNTGNSTGCHIHFEVRKTGGTSSADNGSYGADVDPTELLTAGVDTQTNLNPLAGLEAEISKELGQVASMASQTLIAGGAVLLGTTMTLGGLGLVAWGMAGGTGAQAASLARRTLGRGKSRGRSAPARTPAPGSQGGPRRLATSAGPDEVGAPASSTGATVPNTGRMDRAARPAARRAPGVRVQSEATQLRAQIRAARAARAAAGRQGGQGWVDATVRLNMARNRLRELEPAGAAAARLRR